MVVETHHQQSSLVTVYNTILKLGPTLASASPPTKMPLSSFGCLLLSTLLCSAAAELPIPLLDFNYDHASLNGPENWRDVAVFPNEWEKYVGKADINLDVVGNECHSIRRPSPINLVANAVCEDTHEILTRKIRPNEDCNMTHLNFYSTPQTLRADFPLDDSMCLRPTIDLPNGYPYEWLIHHIEIHLRSEHVLDGRRYDGEMQMYHLGTEDQKRELSAVSILLDASGYEDNILLEQYIDKWQEAAVNTRSECKDARKRGLRYQPKTPSSLRRAVRASTFPMYSRRFQNATSTPRRALDDPEHIMSRAMKREVGDDYAPRRKLFPYDIWPAIHFYRYKGMITTPPCSEIVSWRVMDEPLLISRRQYKMLAWLLQESYVDPDTCEYTTAASPLTGETIRPLQELNHEKQELVHCTPENFSYRLYPPEMV